MALSRAHPRQGGWPRKIVTIKQTSSETYGKVGLSHTRDTGNVRYDSILWYLYNVDTI